LEVSLGNSVGIELGTVLGVELGKPLEVAVHVAEALPLLQQ
jgi:hypothetical protein